MKMLRTVLGVTVAAALVVGYAVAQWAAFNGKSAQYTEALDRLPLSITALVVLAAAVGFSLVRDGDAEGND
jgi:hypothetical protein